MIQFLNKPWVIIGMLLIAMVLLSLDTSPKGITFRHIIGSIMLVNVVALWIYGRWLAASQLTDDRED